MHGFLRFGGTLTTSFTCQQAGPTGHLALPAPSLPVLTSISHRQYVSRRDTAYSPSACSPESLSVVSELNLEMDSVPVAGTSPGRRNGAASLQNKDS